MAVQLSLELVGLDGIPGILRDEAFEINVRFGGTNNDRAVVSGYADILFDPNFLRVDGIEYAAS